MRIYHVAAAEGRRHHVRTALGVDEQVWNPVFRRVCQWRQELHERYGIPEDGELLPSSLRSGRERTAPACNCGLTASRGLEVITAGLRLIEDIAIDTGGVGLINVCLDKDDVPAYRRISLDRVFNRANATAARNGVYASAVIAGGEDEMAVRLYRRLRNYNPVPVRHGPCEDGWSTRNVPIQRVIGGPLFRSAASDPLVQVAGLVAHALLWQEESPAHGNDGGGLGGAFGILDRALNRRAASRIPRGSSENEQKANWVEDKRRPDGPFRPASSVLLMGYPRQLLLPVLTPRFSHFRQQQVQQPHLGGQAEQ